MVDPQGPGKELVRLPRWGAVRLTIKKITFQGQVCLKLMKSVIRMPENSSRIKEERVFPYSGWASAHALFLFPDNFYQTIFHQTGLPSSLHDLACGLHPLSFPWMGLPLTTLYYAYDIIQPRIDFINHFFSKIGISPMA